MGLGGSNWETSNYTDDGVDAYSSYTVYGANPSTSLVGETGGLGFVFTNPFFPSGLCTGGGGGCSSNYGSNGGGNGGDVAGNNGYGGQAYSYAGGGGGSSIATDDSLVGGYSYPGFSEIWY